MAKKSVIKLVYSKDKKKSKFSRNWEKTLREIADFNKELDEAAKQQRKHENQSYQVKGVLQDAYYEKENA